MIEHLKLVSPRVFQSRSDRKAFLQFSEKYGLVYFGYVDQKDDEHRLVRGVTVSTKHRDANYCIGTYGGYDITLVQRHDTLRLPGKTASKPHIWTIMTFDLKGYDFPAHIFIGAKNHSDEFYAQLFVKFPILTKVQLHNLGVYEAAFSEKFTLLCPFSRLHEVERVLSLDVVGAFCEKFNGLSVEIIDGVLYIYSEQKPSATLLTRMLENGLWLAKKCDEA